MCSGLFCLFRWRVLIVAFQIFKDFAKSLQFIDWFADSRLTERELVASWADNKISAQYKRLLWFGEPLLVSVVALRPGRTQVLCGVVLLFSEGLECSILTFIHGNIL